MTEEKKVNGNTVLGANLALQRKAISEESHKAILEGTMSLQAAKDLGRHNGPDGPIGPAPKPVDKDDRTRLCMCQCGRSTRGRFAMGHDQVLLRYAYEHVRGERELTEEQLTYVRDETDKLERAKARAAREDEKTAKRDANKQDK